MIRFRGLLILGAVVGLAAPPAAEALSIQEAMALAQKNNPGLAQSRAQADAAEARLAQARAARLPALTLSGEAGEGTLDLGGFFNLGKGDVSPRAASLELRQPLFAGGSVNAGVDRARAGRDAALAQVISARSLMNVQVAEAYVGVMSAGDLLLLHEAQVRQMTEILQQAEVRFRDGETARTDLAQSEARLAESRAGLARAQGDVARARAHFASVVVAEPEALEPLPDPPQTPASLAEALAMAERANPALAAARASSRAAEAGVRIAQADRFPSLALVATSSQVRDQFFPGYRADGVTVAVQGRWTLFAGGAVNARVSEARADRRGADSGLATARAQLRVAVVGAYQDVETSRALSLAASDQARATAMALDSVRHEVRVGEKPALALLDAEREDLAAHNAVISARGGAVIAAFRLNALLQAD